MKIIFSAALAALLAGFAGGCAFNSTGLPRQNEVSAPA